MSGTCVEFAKNMLKHFLFNPKLDYQNILLAKLFELAVELMEMARNHQQNFSS